MHIENSLRADSLHQINSNSFRNKTQRVRS